MSFMEDRNFGGFTLSFSLMSPIHSLFDSCFDQSEMDTLTTFQMYQLEAGKRDFPIFYSLMCARSTQLLH